MQWAVCRCPTFVVGEAKRRGVISGGRRDWLEASPNTSVLCFLALKLPRHPQAPFCALMADIEGCSRNVFRVCQLPGRVSDRPAAAALLSNALSLPTDHITIFSLATMLHRWEDPRWFRGFLGKEAADTCGCKSISDIYIYISPATF